MLSASPTVGCEPRHRLNIVLGGEFRPQELSNFGRCQPSLAPEVGWRGRPPHDPRHGPLPVRGEGGACIVPPAFMDAEPELGLRRPALRPGRSPTMMFVPRVVHRFYRSCLLSSLRRPQGGRVQLPRPERQWRCALAQVEAGLAPSPNARLPSLEPTPFRDLVA